MKSPDEEERKRLDVRIVNTKTVYQGWARYEVAQFDYKRRDGRVQRVDWEYRDHGEVVVVLPFNPERKTVVLLRQFRFPAYVAGYQGRLWECCAGIIDAGETPEICARRETLEEVGYVVGALTSVGSCFSSPGALTERIHLFLAQVDAPQPGAGGGLEHEGEDIEVVEMPFAEAMHMAENGEIVDMKTLLMLQILNSRFSIL